MYTLCDIIGTFFQYHLQGEAGYGNITNSME